MKKLLLVITVFSLALFACGGGPSEAEKEKQDSIEAAAKADSMLRAELATDTAKADGTKIDTVKH
jgi:hypothetical protein